MQYKRTLMRTSDGKMAISYITLSRGRCGERKECSLILCSGLAIGGRRQEAGKFHRKKGNKWNFWAKSTPLLVLRKIAVGCTVLTVQPPILAIRRNLLASPLGRGQTIGVQRLIGRTQSAWYVS